MFYSFFLEKRGRYITMGRWLDKHGFNKFGILWKDDERARKYIRLAAIELDEWERLVEISKQQQGFRLTEHPSYLFRRMAMDHNDLKGALYTIVSYPDIFGSIHDFPCVNPNSANPISFMEYYANLMEPIEQPLYVRHFNDRTF